MGNIIGLVLIGGFMLFCCYGAYLMVLDSEKRNEKKLDTDQ